MKLAAGAVLVWMVTTALPSATQVYVTDESVQSLMQDMREVYASGDARRVQGFLQHHLMNNGTFEMTMRYTVPAMRLQQKPQTRTLSKQDFIEQTVTGLKGVEEYRYSLQLDNVEIDGEGKSASAEVSTQESGKIKHPLQPEVRMRLNTTGKCTLTLQAQIGLPAIEGMVCDMQTVMR